MTDSARASTAIVAPARPPIFVTGGTGYLGRALIERLVERGHAVDALVRAGSERKLPRGAQAVVGDALRLGEWIARIPRGGLVVHLVGTPKPSPAKSREFEEVDLRSVRVAADAAARAGASHFVYLSVAQPAPIMRGYQLVRAEGERLVRATGMAATFVRPWYVLGPGHRWPLVFLPMYWLFERIPATREGALRLGLVRLEQMTRALVWTIEHPGLGVRVVDVPEIARLARLPDEPRPLNAGSWRAGA